MAKDTVEDARSIDILMLQRDGILNMWPGYRFTSTWRRNEEVVASVSMSLEGFGDGIDAVRLSYSITDWNGEKKAYNYAVRLGTTPCNFGGKRWWFICPLVVSGRPCNRRCRIIYLSCGSAYFGCRECHCLTYDSRKMHRNSFYEGFSRPLKQIEELEEKAATCRDPAKQAKMMRRAHEAYRVLDAFSNKLTKRKGS